MIENVDQSRERAFFAGWWLLFVTMLLVTIGHTALLFLIPGDEVLFLGWIALPLYALVVLLVPYRRH